MRFAIINTADGSIRQINEAFGGTETLTDINNRLDAGQQAIECDADVTLLHKYNSGTGEFDPPA